MRSRKYVKPPVGTMSVPVLPDSIMAFTGVDRRAFRAQVEAMMVVKPFLSVKGAMMAVAGPGQLCDAIMSGKVVPGDIGM